SSRRRRAPRSPLSPYTTLFRSQYFSYNNTYWMRNTDYLRLKNVELGYNAPTDWTKKFGVSSLRVFVSGQNLLTWSGMKVYDPESTNAIGHYYPQARLINSGVMVSF